jgi:hypothetical protein
VRIIILAAATHSFCASSVCAEVSVAPPPAAGQRASVVKLTRQGAYGTAIVGCEHMWDPGTHMTKLDWSQTCRRVQRRFEHLELR